MRETARGTSSFFASLHQLQVKALLEARLESYAGQRVDVMVRSHAELSAVLTNNPFPSLARSLARSLA